MARFKISVFIKKGHASITIIVLLKKDFIPIIIFFEKVLNVSDNHNNWTAQIRSFIYGTICRTWQMMLKVMSYEQYQNVHNCPCRRQPQPNIDRNCPHKRWPQFYLFSYLFRRYCYEPSSSAGSRQFEAELKL